MSLVDLSATLQHETDAAYLFDFGLEEPIWLPKSQCEWDTDAHEVAMPEWLAQEKGLI